MHQVNDKRLRASLFALYDVDDSGRVGFEERPRPDPMAIAPSSTTIGPTTSSRSQLEPRTRTCKCYTWSRRNLQQCNPSPEP